MKPKAIIIMGAAGRDFHNFNTCFRDNPAYRVVAFTATQIPNIERRSYPRELAGSLYPQGIPILPEDELPHLIASHGVRQVVFAYSDISHEDVMHRASLVLASGADFLLLGPEETMLKSRKPVVAVCAVRTGSGKSQASRRVVEVLKELGKRPVVVRHPMPYGDLRAQRLQRFASLQDLERYRCSIEEQEEYEPHLAAGSVVYAGVEYEAILREAEAAADVIVWDGGNNDFPFFRPDFLITLVDPHRPGHELSYHPGETNLLMADAIIITKMGTARAEDVALVKKNIAGRNPRAVVIEADSSVTLDRPELVQGKRVLVVEDGPSVTHGGMPSGAGALAAERYGAGEVVDPRPLARGSIAEVFRKYPWLGPVLPAMGYGEEQTQELEATLREAQVDSIIIGTPVDLRRLFRLNKPAARVRYELIETGEPKLRELLAGLTKGRGREGSSGSSS